MEQRPLGRTGRTISAIGLGCVTFGREIDEESSYRVMDHAFEKGTTFFDTAEGYGGGQSHQGRKSRLGSNDVREKTLEMSSSELIIGRWLRSRGCRDQVTLCTKVGTGGSAENVNRALAASLERLGTDRVDVYKMHSPDPNTPIAETLAALNAEVEAGRVSVIGGSNYSSAQLQQALVVSLEIDDPLLLKSRLKRIRLDVRRAGDRRGEALERIELFPELPSADPADGTLRYQTTWRPANAGQLLLRVVEPTLDDLEITQRIEVVRPDDELRNPRPDQDRLAQLAQQTGGAVIAPDHLDQLPALVPDDRERTAHPRRESLWDSYLALFLVVLLLTAEWVGRKVIRLA